MNDDFHPCEICGSSDWHPVYRGIVRDGSFGRLSSGETVVAQCGGCGVQRLNEQACAEDDLYETEAYRRLLTEPEDAAGFFAGHDVVQIWNIMVLWPEMLRAKRVADIGCAGGSFLDQVSGVLHKGVCVEPCQLYHESLRSRGYDVYGSLADAAAEWSDRIDYTFSFSVVEHVRDPVDFLRGIRSLMAPSGKCMISTPNREDILMSLKGEEYQRFFYRTVHRWYFNVDSFAACARRAGLKVVDTTCVQRFGLSNAMAWLRDGRPTGFDRLPFLESDLADDFWKRYVEDRGVGDYLYFRLIKD